MGKSLIIKGADFSTNGIQENVSLDITDLVAESGTFKNRNAVGGFFSAGENANTKRCCFLRLQIPTLLDISAYSKVRIDIVSGFDYVLGVCRNSTPDSSNSWDQLNGTSDTGGSFTWVTDNQFIEVPLSPTMYITGNIRYDDNTTEFSASTVVSDVATFTLLP